MLRERKPTGVKICQKIKNVPLIPKLDVRRHFLLGSSITFLSELSISTPMRWISNLKALYRGNFSSFWFDNNQRILLPLLQIDLSAGNRSGHVQVWGARIFRFLP